MKTSTVSYLAAVAYFALAAVAVTVAVHYGKELLDIPAPEETP